MKQYVLIVSLLGSVLSCQASDVVGWQEFPRVTIADKCLMVALQSLSASMSLYFIDLDLKKTAWLHDINPLVFHGITPSIGALSLCPSLITGFKFKRKADALKIQKIYDSKIFTDPLLYVNAFEHPFNSKILIVSGAGLWKAYTAIETEMQPEFACRLFKSLDYDSVEWALRSTREAKKQVEKALQDLKKYSDIEDRLNRVIYFQEQKPVLRFDHLLKAEPEDLEVFVEQILDSGTYCQEVTIHTLTKQVSMQEAPTWYGDDFVYHYASRYGFELLKTYSRLLALEKIWSLHFSMQ